MKTILLLFVLVTTMASCNLQRICALRFPPQVDSSVVIKDSIIKVYELVDVEVPIFIPKDSVVMVFKDSIQYRDSVHLIFAKSKYVQGSLTVKNGVITAKCNTDSLQQILARVRDTLTHTREIHSQVSQKTITVTKEVPTPFLPKVFWLLLAYAFIRTFFDVKSFIPGLNLLPWRK